MLLFQTLNSVNFQNLTFLICHLLIGGKFQTVQVLHGPNALNHHLMHDIGKNCLNEITWMAIDITQSEIPKWNDTMKPVEYIQLIFIDSDVQSEVQRLLSEFPPIYYRLFVFHPNGNQSFIRKISNKTKLESDSDSVGLFYDGDGEINAHLLHEDLTAFHQAINLQDLNEPLTSAQVFDKIFGERAKMRKLGIYYANPICQFPLAGRTYLFHYFHSIFKYVYTQLNMDFIDVAQLCDKQIYGYLRPISLPIYDEVLSWDMERIENGSKE